MPPVDRPGALRPKKDMRTQTIILNLDRPGVDSASEAIQSWLESEGLQHRDILRIRLTMEDVLATVCDHADGAIQAELHFSKRLGDLRLRVRYDGDKFDPTAPSVNELDGWSSNLLARTGFRPAWRWRAKRNELMLRIPSKKHRTELVLLGCVAAALVVGLLGQFMPEAVKEGTEYYALSFLSQSFLHLLSSFIGVLIFLSIVTGICGIGSASDFGRVGKLMISRFIVITILVCGIFVFAVHFFFPLSRGAGGGGSQLHAILEMIFDIIPSNPVQPFLEGNTLQIVFLATIIGVVLLLTGSATEGIRSLFFQAQTLVTRCIAGICMLLPIYIFSSLVMLFWRNGAGVILQFWKPIVLSVFLCLSLAAGYILVVCRKFRVKASVLIPKLLPDFLIVLTTASSSAAFSASMDINETKLGIDPSFSRTAVPVGGILFAASVSLFYIMSGAFLAEYYHVEANIAWWIILWLVCSLLAMATPPVAGGMVSCLSILLMQMNIPQEGMVIGATLTMIMDFYCTSIRVAVLHLEMLLQADRLGLLDLEILRSKN